MAGEVSSASRTTELAAGDYKVAFRPGTWTPFAPKSSSYYEVSMIPKGDEPAAAISVESELSRGIFKEAPGAEPSKQIRAFVSGSGDTLLIEEVLPVAAQPRSNWILVKRHDGDLSHEYLLPPQRQVKASDGKNDIPRVTSVSDSEVSFHYSDGRKITTKVKDLVKK
ncbi:MAG: hypothetical protein EOP85_13850 [Verrucomicrobiaceae bacterium]|nr:MAG: hypothetical protein EOP85_13850 [Verrucomicrobiaceae bacterium]